jgi:hypothetical protein
MKRQPLNPFAQTLHDSVDHISTPLRGPKPTRLLIAILALGLPLMQTVPALAGEQVLEIPQSVAIPAAPRHVPDLYDTIPPTSSDADAYAAAGTPADAPAPPPASVAANSPSYAPDPNLGSIDDYQNQPGENGRPPSFALGGGGTRPEPPASMTTNLILGGILVGMVALEIASRHQRHR